MTLTDRLRSVLTDAKERAAADDSGTAIHASGSHREESAGEPETSLFESTSCDSVFVAVENSTALTVTPLSRRSPRNFRRTEGRTASRVQLELL